MKKFISVFLVTLLICLTLTGCKSSDYNNAVKLQESGDYSAALTIFESIEDYANYKDSATRVDECKAMIAALDEYDSAKASLEQKNVDLENAIAEANALVQDKKPALDDTLSPSLEAAISTAKAAKQNIIELPETADIILEAANTMESADYTSVLEDLNNSKDSLEKSIKQYELVNAPTEAYIITCLKRVDNIVDIAAATEDNDPNGHLNKDGGYTAQVYFTSDLINQSSVIGSTVIEKGTAAGGSIEVYRTPEEAIKRENYLAGFDGSVFATGSHLVIGTVIIRTSDELTATQQNQLEAAIVDSLTNLNP